MQEPNSPLQALAAIIARHQPHSALLCSAQQSSTIESEIRQYVSELSSIDAQQAKELEIPAERFDLIMVADLLERLTKAEGIRLLGRLRNAHSNRLFLFFSRENSSENWSSADFYGLGLHEADVFATGGNESALFSYDIGAYNHTRDWNNARFWANPQNFGRYWW